MNWRWLTWDFVDPALPLTYRERLRCYLRPILIGNLPRGTRRGRVWFFLSMMVLGLGCFLVPLWLTGGRGLSSRFFLLWFALMMIVFWIGGVVAYGVFCRRENLHRVRLDGYEVCMNCGYWLRGLDDNVTKCPECGAEREPMSEMKQ